ncbi:MAG: hypothetical protein Q9216_004682 [Gyalolechia sp. 2 TL-2023]
MGGASKRRARAERQANLGSRDNGGSGESKARYDGPSERPGSSTGPGQASSSHGRAPSNAPAPSGPSGPLASTRSSSRPPSAGGPAQSSRPPSARGPPLRDPARDPSKPEQPKLNPRIEWGGNAFNYFSEDAMSYSKDPFDAGFDPSAESIMIPIERPNLIDGTPIQAVRQVITDVNPYREQMPRVLMRRPGFGKVGEKLRVRLNSHYVEGTPSKIFYQYDGARDNYTDASCDVKVQIGNGAEKRGLIKTAWGSNALNNALPGTRNNWIFDGNQLAWQVFDPSSHNLQREFRLEVDLDTERGRQIPSDRARDTVRIVIRPASTGAKIDLNNIYEYLNSRVPMGPPVFDAINFLDHLIREYPSKTLVSVKRSYFHPQLGDSAMIGGGIDAMRGVYQSIRMAEGKRLVLNIDVSHSTFWHVASFPAIINQLTGHQNLDTVQTSWRDAKSLKTNFKYEAMKRLRANSFTVAHKGRSREEAAKIHRVASIIPKSTHEYKFQVWDREKQRLEPEISIFDYYHKTYNVYLNFPHLPLVSTGRMITKRDSKGNEVSKGPIVFPMELCTMCESQRYPYKLNEGQTAQMIKFAVKNPHERLQGINKGLDMLDWAKDPYLHHFGLKINRDQIQTNARLLPAPKLQFNGSIVEPGIRGSWDLIGKKFLTPNTAPLIAWGVTVIQSTSYQTRIQTPEVHAFVQAFIQAYKAHGGMVKNEDPLIHPGHADVPKAVELLFYAVGNKHQIRPQLLLFILPNKNADVYLRIKKSCDCRWGAQSQCVQSGNAQKKSPQYLSNVLMKVNAKLGGTTNRVATVRPSGHFSRPTMIIGADVSHAAPGIHAPSYAAMTVSMDKYAVRYAAGVQSNGFRVEMISTKNLRDMLIPLFRHWTANVSGGRLPDHIYYFRDGVSEGQFTKVLRNEVGDIKEILMEMGETRKDYAPQFTVVVAEKRHHIRFFPQGKGADKGGNPVPGVVVDHDVTHPFENDIYLCSHKAIKGTARPTHYTMLMDEANVPVDEFQKMLYEQCYQYIRSTTAVSLHPAVYYAHLASNRARSHENISESDRLQRDHADPSKSTSEKSKEEAKALIPMINVDNINYRQKDKRDMAEMAEVKTKKEEEVMEAGAGGAKQAAKDLFSGAVGGVAQVLIDIVKVRLQTTTRYTGAVDAATKILKDEGPLAFYKGTLTPLIGIGACVSVQFGGFHYARRQFEARNTLKGQPPALSYSQLYASGAFAGLANSFLSGPIEHVRIRLQTQPHGAGRLYSGPLDCVRKLGAHEGILRGVYRGQAVTLLREAQAYGVWFLSFEYMMNRHARANAMPRSEISAPLIALYGGIAGEALWMASYPFDVVKSKMQSDGFGAGRRYASMRGCFGQVWQEAGIRGFWKGLGPTLVRALPVSAGTFIV